MSNSNTEAVSKVEVFVKRWLPIIVFIGSLVYFGINYLKDAPVFMEPKYMYVTKDTFMEYLENDKIFYLPRIYECITNESNDWINRSLIELVEIKLSDGIAINTHITFDIYDSLGYREDGLCVIPLQVPEISSSETTMDLKTFVESRTILFPLSITAPFYDEQSGEKVINSEELIETEKIIIKYLPKEMKYKNGRWQQIPLLKGKQYTLTFDGMKVSNPIYR